MTSYSGGPQKGESGGAPSKRGGGGGSSKGPASSSSNPTHIPEHLSFYVRIEPLSPDYGPQGQSIRHEEGGYWIPPNRPNGLRNGQGPVLLLRWRGGRINIVPPNDQIRSIDLDRTLYHAATVFTQYPDNPHLLAVPFNARTRSVYEYGRGWQAITFNHNRVGNRDAYFSYISDRGAEQKIAAPGSPHWIHQLLPDWYNCSTRHATRNQAGLIGELPLLFALAAFSAPPTSQGVIPHSIAPGAWVHHEHATGHIAERGMVVTVYTDPLNPHWSTTQLLDSLQNGVYGPFYGP